MKPLTVDELEALYRARYTAFVRVASAIAGDPASGVDALHDAFANAIASRRTYRGEAPLEAWVWRIVIRCAGAVRQRELPLRTDPAGANGNHHDNGEGIRRLVAALPERQRHAVFLRYFADLDYRAIAAALSIEVGTVSATLQRSPSRPAPQPGGGKPMSDVDQLIRDELDDAYARPDEAPDWEEVLRRLPRSAGRRRKLLLGAALVLGATAAALTAVGVPWRAGPSFADRALAAIGSQRYVYAVVEPEQSYSAVVDLATGKERPVSLRQAYLFDSGSTERIPTVSSWSSEDGVVVSSSDQISSNAEPGLAAFLDGYRKQLADGSAKVLGETTYRGRSAKLLRFTSNTALRASSGQGGQQILAQTAYSGGSSEDVAVDSETFRPLWIRRNDVELIGSRVQHNREQRYRVISITSMARPPARPPAVGLPDTYARPAFDQVTLKGARDVLGVPALWAGTRVGALRFERVALDEIQPGNTASATARPGRGLRFAYGTTLEIREATAPQPSYRFTSTKLVPPVGKVRVRCYGCGTVGDPPFATTEAWSGQLREGRLWISVKAPTRALLLAAVRALAPVP